MKISQNITLAFLFITLISACTPVPTISGTPKEATASIVTATPIPFDFLSQNLSNEIDIRYNNERGSCDEIEHLNYSSEDIPIVFRDITTEADLSKLEIQELADNIDGTYRAYVLSEYFCEAKNSDCRKNIIYWQNKVNNQIYQIEWVKKKLYLYRSTIWMGKNILVIREAAFPGSYGIVGIDVEKQELVYYGVVKNCK